MGDFLSNSQMYNIVTETELASVLSHYSSDFVFSVVQDALRKRFDVPNFLPNPNIVAAFEQNFKIIRSQYSTADVMDEINRVRLMTYKEIIDFICKEFNLSFTVSEDVDLYSAAYILYQFFVADFSNNLISFFTNFIFRERNNLYESLGLAELKKNKDSSTIYGKKIFKDIKLAVINANIDTVISAISTYDIDLYTIFSIIIPDRNVANNLYMLVSSNGDFFKQFFVDLLHRDIRPAFITSIRIRLQELSRYTEPPHEDIEE